MCQFSKKVLASPQRKTEDQNPKVFDIAMPGHPDDQCRWQKVVIRYNTPRPSFESTDGTPFPERRYAQRMG